MKNFQNIEICQGIDAKNIYLRLFTPTKILSVVINIIYNMWDVSPQSNIHCEKLKQWFANEKC